MYFLRLCSTASIIIAALVHAEEQIPLNSEKQEWKVGQVVKTTSGRLQGHSSLTFPSISEYLGIPYAQAPLKSLRFAAPKAYKAENDGALFIADKFVMFPSSLFFEVLSLQTQTEEANFSCSHREFYRNGLREVLSNDWVRLVIALRVCLIFRMRSNRS